MTATLLWGTSWAVSPANSSTDFNTSKVSIIGTIHNPVAHWPLDEGTGTIAHDLSRGIFTGRLMNVPTWSNRWLNFDGHDDYVDVGVLDVTGERLTLSAWFRLDPLNNCSFIDCRIISKAGGVSNDAHYWMLSTIRTGKTTRLRFRLKTNDVTTTLIADSGDIVAGKWIHVAAVYDGTQMYLYKDGVAVASRPKTGTMNTDSAIPVWIGGNPPGATDRPWQGQISDVRIYDQALTAEEIQTTALSSAGKAGDYALFFDRFMGSTFYLAKLEGLADETPPLIKPIAIKLQGFIGKLGNPDVSFDGKIVVFAALVEEEWNIYQGDLDVVNAEIKNIQPLADKPGVREEDPRISWDGIEVVYKCDGDICIADLDSPGSGMPVVSDLCELFGPVFDDTATVIAYTRRCSAEENDRVVVRDIITGSEFEIESEGGGPDRFPHFLADGRLLYSHLEIDNTVNLWQYDLNDPMAFPSLFHDRTVSDDDLYVHKQSAGFIFFLGFNFEDRLYDLYMYSDVRGNSVRLSVGQSMLGTVVFRRDGL